MKCSGHLYVAKREEAFVAPLFEGKKQKSSLNS